VGSWSSTHFQVWYKPRLKMQLSLNSAHMEKEISDEFHSFHGTFTKPNSIDNKVLEPKEKHTKIVHFTKQNFTQRTQQNEVYPLYLICQEKSVFARRIKFYLRRQIHIYPVAKTNPTCCKCTRSLNKRAYTSAPSCNFYRLHTKHLTFDTEVIDWVAVKMGGFFSQVDKFFRWRCFVFPSLNNHFVQVL
jgi:hypothetical protein